MTKFISVASPSHPELQASHGWTLVQADWARKNPEYLKFFKEQYTGSIILDYIHPVKGERQLTKDMQLGRYLEVYTELSDKVLDIVVPDVFGERQATLDRLVEFIERATYLTDWPDSVKWLVVPQGKTYTEWLQSFFELVTYLFKHRPHMTVGVPKSVEQWVPRRGLIDVLDAFLPSSVDIHMLGCWKGWTEMFHNPRVRSWDTSLPIAHAQQFLLSKDVGSDKVELLPQLGMSEQQLSLARENIKWFEGIVSP